MSGETLKVNVLFCFSGDVLQARLPKMSPKDVTETYLKPELAAPCEITVYFSHDYTIVFGCFVCRRL